MALEQTNEVEVKCSYCGLIINPGRGIHGIGRKVGRWLHPLCKMSSDRLENKYLRSHNLKANQENGRKSRRSPALTETDGSDEEMSQPRTNHPMAFTEAEELQYRIRSESSLPKFCPN